MRHIDADNASRTGFTIQENVPLGALSTLGVGGRARFFVRARARTDIARAAAWAAERGVPLFVLGGGSNVLIADEGFPGLVLAVAIGGVETETDGDRITVTAGAGEPWDPLVEMAVENGWAGFECLSGIPGLVGATPIQNVGAYGQEVSQTIVRVEALHLDTGREVSFSGEECRFAYRDSRFKREDAGRYIVLSVRYRLRRGGQPLVRYAELRQFLEQRGMADPSLADVRRAVIEVRRGKSMVLDPGDPNSRSAGSFFVNPIVTADRFRAIEAAAAGEMPDARVPSFPAPDGMVKVPAAWLIERAGFTKGYRRGNAALSTKHALAIVNRGGATASEIAALAREIRDRVRDRFCVELTPEPVFLGVSLD